MEGKCSERKTNKTYRLPKSWILVQESYGLFLWFFYGMFWSFWLLWLLWVAFTDSYSFGSSKSVCIDNWQNCHMQNGNWWINCCAFIMNQCSRRAGWDGFRFNTMRSDTGWYSTGSDGLRERKNLMLDHSNDGTAGFRFPCWRGFDGWLSEVR